MRRNLITLKILGCIFLSQQMAFSQENNIGWKQPKEIAPGVLKPDGTINPPSDAIVLFDGKDQSQFENLNGGEPGWLIKDGVLTVVPNTGDIQTKRKFRDFQLHIEWRIPEDVQGEGQERGNSGIFLQGKYEIQVLDSNRHDTYFNGMAGNVYNQMPPLVNAMRKPGEWNVYDIIYTAPTFKDNGTFRSLPIATVIQKGILVQNYTMIMGITNKDYHGYPLEEAHRIGQIRLQDYHNPISFRKI